MSGARPSTALVLSGGGARGAYQVGVLRELAAQGFLDPRVSGLDILVGSSAGAINAAAVAATMDDFEAGLARLDAVWRSIQPSQVYRTDIASLSRIGARWAWDLSFGGATRHVQPKSLLDTAPLRTFLGTHIDFPRIAQNVARRHPSALAVIATDLHTSNGVIFLEARPDLPDWRRRRWRIERGAIGLEHLLASSAIPIFFPSVEIAGQHFGDGSIRNTAPLSPAINLGAQRIVAVGVSGPPPSDPGRGPREPPTVAQIAGVLLDAVMLDAIEVDVDHGERVNTAVLQCASSHPGEPFRKIDLLLIRPSHRVRELADELAHRMPAVVRYLLRGLGSDSAVTELASYLLFDAVFCGKLIDLGREDVRADRDRIRAFFDP